MRNKLFAIALSGVLCTSGLTLTACSGGADTSGGSSDGGETTEQTQQVEVDPAEKFQGTWKFAAMEYQGVMVGGDLSAMFSSIAGNTDDADDADDADAQATEAMNLTINAGGAGTMNLFDDEQAFAWELKDDNTITITPERDADDEDAPETLDVVYADDALSLTIEQDDVKGTMFFTADGTYPGMVEITSAALTDITDQSALVGDWGLAGMNMMGMTVYGSAADVAAMAGTDETKVTFAEDGTVDFMGTECNWTVDEDGAALSMSGFEIPLKALGDDIAIDLSDMMGMDFIMAFGK